MAVLRVIRDQNGMKLGKIGHIWHIWFMDTREPRLFSKQSNWVAAKGIMMGQIWLIFIAVLILITGLVTGYSKQIWFLATMGQCLFCKPTP